MRSLIIIALALALGVTLIWLADFEPGFVLLQYGRWTLETSLMVLAVVLLVVVVAFYLLLRSISVLRGTPQKLADWQANHRHKKANQALTRGLITLEEGRWREAERILIRHAGNSETPLLHYLAAARAAQKQNAPQRRDNYLKLAHETTEGADIAVGVVQAELQLSAGQKEQALATLQHLREMAPKHPYVLQQLQQLYQDTDQWHAVQAVLPDLRRRHVLDADSVKALSAEASVAQLNAALLREDWQKMEQIWQQSSARVRQSEPMLVPYVKGLVEQGEYTQAIELIEQFLRKDWSDTLVYQYGLIAHGGLLKRLATAEKWLKQREDNPWLLLTLGRLAQASRLWAKAEAYLRASLEHGPRGETFQVLSDVLSAQSKTQAASQTCRQGLDFVLKNGQ